MRRRFLASTLAALVAATPVLAPPASAQSGDRDLFFDTLEVNLANLEVIVTDGDGRPVHGLEKKDFQVFEDGVEVEVTHFFGVEGRRAVSSATDGSIVGEPATKQLFLVVFLDLLTLRPESRNRVFESLREYLHKSLGESDQVMLVAFDGKAEIVERFTHDTAKLEASLDRLSRQTTAAQQFDVRRNQYFQDLRRASVPQRPLSSTAPATDFELAISEALRLHGEMRNLVQAQYNRVVAAADGLASFCGSLAGLRGRKAVLLVSQGLADRPGEELVRAWAEKYESWSSSQLVPEVSRELPGLELAPRSTSTRLTELVRTLSSYQVAVYPLSPPARSVLAGGSAAVGAMVSPGGPTNFSAGLGAQEMIGQEQALLTVADGTGGVAFTRSPNLGGLLDRVAQDFSDFYSLAYTPLHPGDAKFHEVRVEVRGRPELRVRHFRGYVEHESLAQLRNITLSALRYDVDENPLGVALSTGDHQATVSNRFRVPLLITVPLANLALLPNGAFLTGKLTAFVIAEQDQTAQASDFQRVEIPIALPEAQAERIPTDRTGTWVELLMKPGRQRVAVGMRDEIARVDAAISIEVEVGIAKK